LPRRIAAFHIGRQDQAKRPYSDISIPNSVEPRWARGVARVLVAEEILHQAEVGALFREGVSTCVSQHMG
jgi:hypothetical protein